VNATRAVGSQTLVAGVLWALAAGLCWGTAFLAPLLLPAFHAVEITAGRYVAYGIFALLPIAFTVMRGPVLGLGELSVWRQAFALSAVGNLVYFCCVIAGIQLAGAPIAALIIGALPVTLPIAASLTEPDAKAQISLRRLIVPSLLMLAGLAAVHIGEHGALTVSTQGASYWSGIGLITAALLAWTWYGVANARALAARSDISAATWSSLQGITLLPVVVPVLAYAVLSSNVQASWGKFAAVSLMLGIVPSWLAMWCWNRASQLLPATLAGQLIVFETVAALAYAYAWKLSWPPLLVVTGAALLLGGVLLGTYRLAR
jgi:drug/metabolite transporter (DMT)-like permease